MELTSVVVCVGEEGMANFRKRVTSAAPMALIPNGVDVERFRAASLKRNVTRHISFDASPKEVIPLQVGRIMTRTSTPVAAPVRSFRDGPGDRPRPTRPRPAQWTTTDQPGRRR